LAAAPLHAQAQSGSQQSSQQGEDPVADAARKAREQKRDQPKPKKVYTEDDIPRAPRPSEQPAPSAPPDAQGTPAPEDAAPGAPGKNDERTWRSRFKAQREKIARAEKELDVLQRESEKVQLQYYPDPQKALSEQNSRKEINEKYTKIAAKKKELDDLKRAFSDLEDALRKAGGDSGWARE